MSPFPSDPPLTGMFLSYQFACPKCTLQNPPSRNHQILLLLFKPTELYKCCRKRRNASRKIMLLDDRQVQNVVESWKTKGRDSFESYIQLLHQHSTLLKLFIIQNVHSAPTTYGTIIFPMTLSTFKMLTIPQHGQWMPHYLNLFL